MLGAVKHVAGDSVFEQDSALAHRSCNNNVQLETQLHFSWAMAQ